MPYPPGFGTPQTPRPPGLNPRIPQPPGGLQKLQKPGFGRPYAPWLGPGGGVTPLPGPSVPPEWEGRPGEPKWPGGGAPGQAANPLIGAEIRSGYYGPGGSYPGAEFGFEFGSPEQKAVEAQRRAGLDGGKGLGQNPGISEFERDQFGRTMAPPVQSPGFASPVASAGQGLISPANLSNAGYTGSPGQNPLIGARPGIGEFERNQFNAPPMSPGTPASGAPALKAKPGFGYATNRSGAGGYAGARASGYGGGQNAVPWWGGGYANQQMNWPRG